MKKFEYLVIDLPEGDVNYMTQQIPQKQQALLNQSGQDGWELVAVIPSTGWDGHGLATRSKAYLKRELA